ncbi:hypothetical protein HHL16_12140 [Pseudoflavitalea sp. G-6-1-2]|uniref:hypothetical protein n=1 Tax=Pseudoflavitalea sp. G-6-1-2 TaxID=2728841 RepID=UPI00146DCA87|nr:hypothetical protein [Pseudoflavitalea sp. G-6-1-2]NML21631.1 hypothetical protein [Pseudoflavitalea sp. G-6-1-2]
MKQHISFLKVAPAVLLGTAFLAFSSCKKEAALTPSEDNRLYHMPQGNKPVDQQIMQVLNKYRTYILYNFTEPDFIYTPTGPFSRNATATSAGPEHAQEAMDFLNANLFSLYPEEFLQKAMPLKILLAKDLIVPLQNNYPSSDLTPTYPAARDGYNHIVLGWTNRIATLTPAEVDSTRGQLNASLLMVAINRGLIPMPTGFDKVTVYSGVGLTPNTEGVYKTYTQMGATEDLRDHLTSILTNDYATLESTVFIPSRDVNGKFRKKYDLIIDFFKDTYGIDLQEIGNK